MKTHASALGSRSGGTTPLACPARSAAATKSCTSRMCRRIARRTTGSSPASVRPWIQRFGIVGLRHGDCWPVGAAPPVKSAILSSSRVRVSSHAASRHAIHRSRFEAKWR
jgi:hypothetical protein